MSSDDLLVVAGEASGDQHAARLVQALRRKRPGLRVFGLGADELASQGVELVADSREISVVGIVEAWTVLSRAREIFELLLAEVDRRRPTVAVLVDFPDFNLRLARALRWRGVRVVYYVSPQIWAWRRWRVRTIAETVDRMLVLFPFELSFYEEAGVPVFHVGHPLVDEVPQMPQAWDGIAACTLPERYRLVLLPGSRRSEIAALMPVMLASAAKLSSRLHLTVSLIRAPGLSEEEIRSYLAEAPPGLDLEVISRNRLASIASAHLALCASGTATLETGLLGTPLIVLYRLSRWTYWLARAMVRVPHASLVNLVLERPVVPELLQHEATAERVVEEAERLLTSRSEIGVMRTELSRLRARLGRPGASERAAAAVVELLAEQERAA